jgi:protein TonB
VFDSVLGKGNSPSGKIGRAAIVSILTHAAVLGLILWVGTRPALHDAREAAVTFFAPPSPPPAGNGESRASKPKIEKPKVQPTPKVDTLVQPKKVPVEKPQEAEPKPEEPSGAQPGGVTGGVEGGVAGGVVGGTVGGVVGGQLGGQLGGVLNFQSGMTRPERLSGKDPVYTREALEARVEGVMIVKCTITAQGDVTDCRVIKPLPHMTESVLETVKTWKYKPVTFEGKPVSVGYNISIRLVLPR